MVTLPKSVCVLGGLPLSILKLNLHGLTLLFSGLQESSSGSAFMEEAAQKMAEFLRSNLVDENNQPAFALVRIFKSMRYDRLEPALQAIAAPQKNISRCLVLLGTDGAEPAWKSRAGSINHKVIVLDSPAAL